jgi:CIC family chloride channel protein
VVGAAVGRLLPTTPRERRILLVAGVAAGIAAIFRTPLGAALLATELMYRDDFESDALVPSVFASVVAYSVVIAVFGETRLFAHLPRFPFQPMQLPLYAAAAVAVCIAAVAFVGLLRAVQRWSARTRLPTWLRPAAGGLAMGCVGVALLLWVRQQHGDAAAGFSVFGGGYGVLQVAMTGADWLSPGWAGVGLLLSVAILKMVASALTIGTGAATGDFAPALVVGGLVGAAFGMAARLALHDPGIQPAAFALVGMGTLYGGLAHAPLAALVLVAELAGSYDLLVPMMFAIGIAYVALRRHSLYPAQRPRRTSPEGTGAAGLAEAVSAMAVAQLMIPPEVGPQDEHATLAALSAAAAPARRQRVLAVLGASGRQGLVELEWLAQVPPPDQAWMRASDAAVRFASLPPTASWGALAELLERCGVSQIPVVAGDEVVGWAGDRELRAAIARTHLVDAPAASPDQE